MKKAFLLLMITSVVLYSCKKDEPEPQDNNNSSTSTGDYLPATKNSTWSYVGENGAQSYTITCLGDTVIEGKKYARMANSAASGEGYNRKDGGSYYSRAEYSPGNILELLFLKDNEPVGGTWTSEHTINTIPTKYEYTIEGKGLTITVKGKEYNNVINVLQKTYVDYTHSGSWSLANSGNYMYAKDVGFILSDLGSLGKTSLVSYDIK